MSKSIRQLLITNDTGFVEFQVSIASMLFALTMLFATPDSWIIQVSTMIMPRFMWSILLLAVGCMKLYGYVKHDNNLRMVGSSMSILIWSFWAIILVKNNSFVWPLFAVIPLQMAWVIFRTGIENKNHE